MAVLIVPDFNLVFDMDSPHIRLLNLTQRVPLSLGLAFSAPFENVTQPDSGSGYRASIPVGIHRFIDGILAGSYSGSARPVSGDVNLIIMDSDANQVTYYLTNVTLEPGKHYDVVAYQLPGTYQVTAFILPYPAP